MAAQRRCDGSHADAKAPRARARLRSDHDRCHARCDGPARDAVSAAPVIEVKLAGAVVRVASGMDDAAQLTAVLRAVRASASRT